MHQYIVFFNVLYTIFIQKTLKGTLSQSLCSFGRKAKQCTALFLCRSILSLPFVVRVLFYVK